MTQTVDENDIGAAVIRLQHDTATTEDVSLAANVLVRSSDFRERCSVLGQMAMHLPERKRQENAEALCSIIFEKHLPVDEVDPLDNKEEWAVVTPMFIVQCAPMKDSVWAPHFAAEFAKSNAMKKANVSPYVVNCVRAVEAMWGVAGHLIPA